MGVPGLPAELLFRLEPIDFRRTSRAATGLPKMMSKCCNFSSIYRFPQRRPDGLYGLFRRRDPLFCHSVPLPADVFRAGKSSNPYEEANGQV
jgi:hypothetical protein